MLPCLLSSLLLFAPGQIHVDASHTNCPGSGTQSDPYCRIQDAIFAALDGDEILVRPGSYHEPVDVRGKAVKLRSTAGPEVTRIEGPNAGIFIVDREASGTLVEGFTVTAGHPNASGVYVSRSSPTLRNNHIVDCGYAGIQINGGVYGETVALMNNTITGSKIGLLMRGGLVRAEGNRIVKNVSPEDGAGVAMNGGEVELIDNVLAENSGAFGGGLFVSGAS